MGAQMMFTQFRRGALCGASLIAAMAGQAAAQDHIIISGGKPDAHGVAPLFAVIQRQSTHAQGTTPTGSPPPTWTYSYSYQGRTYSTMFVGTPVSQFKSTTVPVYLVPIAMQCNGTTYDPTVVQQNGVSIIQNVINSPIFQKSVKYVQGGRNLGTTQYIDAFQRATLWGIAGAHTGYHVLLGNTQGSTLFVEPVQTLNLNSCENETDFNTNVVTADIGEYDAAVRALITSLGIPANALPLFITTQSYLTSSGCCIGGYHTYFQARSQPYASATYITTSGAFSEDVSALSHEIGEWMDDPYGISFVPVACGIKALLEVGDPLENGQPGHPFGTYAYPVNGVTWHLQDLVLLPYFGAPANISVNHWSTFQGQTLSVCQNGG